MFKENLKTIREKFNKFIDTLFPDVEKDYYSDYYTCYTYKEAIKFANDLNYLIPENFKSINGIYFLNMRTKQAVTEVPEKYMEYFVEQRKRKGIFTPEEKLKQKYCAGKL